MRSATVTKMLRRYAVTALHSAGFARAGAGSGAWSVSSFILPPGLHVDCVLVSLPLAMCSPLSGPSAWPVKWSREIEYGYMSCRFLSLANAWAGWVASAPGSVSAGTKEQTRVSDVGLNE